jgi:cytochrome b pre-mRNA-processing protein 3
MISFPFRRTPQDQTIDALYGAIVAQARTADFYLNYGVPDTVTGRFEMIVLHLALVLRRLRGAPQVAGVAGQGVFDRFCRDMDDNFREMGVGDLGVPKQMRKVAEAYYGRAKAYDIALDRGSAGDLADAIGRNVFGAAVPPAGARRLVTYINEAILRLDATDDRDLAAGRLEFPDPAATHAVQFEGPIGS